MGRSCKSVVQSVPRMKEVYQFMGSQLFRSKKQAIGFVCHWPTIPTTRKIGFSFSPVELS
jgi:hypothetical protein